MDNIDDYHEIYEEIIKLNKNDNRIEAWQTISTLMHTRSDIFSKLYRKLRHDETRKEIKIPYSDKISDLQKQIKTETNLIIQTSLITGVLHQIIYDLMSAEGNYKLLLDGPEEMIVLKKQIKYYVSISDKIEKNILFHAFILLFAVESLFNTHFYVGIDFEYTGQDPVFERRKIQLAQLNFEHNTDLRSIIMIVSPDELKIEPIINKNFVRLIMCNGHIKKIIHGADALDMPYLYKELLEDDTTKVMKFTRALIDTKLLCEYYKLNLKVNPGNKCAMYKVLTSFDVISPEQDAKLDKVLQANEPHQDREWDNIRNMPKNQLLYALYDVIFLKYFYYKIIASATSETDNIPKKKTIITLYKHVLYELSQFAYLEKSEYTFVVKTCKEEIDPLNNFMIRYKVGTKNQKIMKLIDIYNKVNTGIVTTDPVADIDSILKVNYFSKVIAIIIKKMTYTLAGKMYSIYKDKNTIWSAKLDNKFIFEFFGKMNYEYLGRMFKDIESTLEQRLRTLIES